VCSTYLILLEIFRESWLFDRSASLTKSIFFHNFLLAHIHVPLVVEFDTSEMVGISIFTNGS
jgi:hypothetical protein